MLAGEIMNVGGLSRRIVDLALTLVGHVRGGLGYVTIVAACLMAALSGSAVADAAALTALLLPMMVAAGHDKARRRLIAVGGIIGADHPAVDRLRDLRRRGQRVDQQAVPGRHRARPADRPVALWLTWWWLAGARTIKPPPEATAAQRWAAHANRPGALLLPVIVLVGLADGVFTPTEAAVVAAVYALSWHVGVPRTLDVALLTSCLHHRRPRPPR